MQCGYAINPDFNGGEQDGVGWYQVTQFNGERWKAQRAFIAPALSRGNLHVVQKAQVRRLVLSQGRLATAMACRPACCARSPVAEWVCTAQMPRTRP